MRSRSVLAALFGAGLALLLSLPSPAEEAAQKEKIDKFIQQLGSGSFAEREKATKELTAIGLPALEALRQAAKSDDAEIRKRAEDILPRIERQAENMRILAPKRVHLNYNDTPLAEAVADFQKKSGYVIHLHDPEGRLKERKITLDTGETTFWHALGMFCDKAELTEGTLQDLIQPAQPPVGIPGVAPFPAPKQLPPLPPAGKGLAQPAPAAPPPAAAPKPAVQKGQAQPAQAAPPVIKPAIVRRPIGRPMIPANFSAEQIILKDGKPKKLPTDDASAVRVRALGKSETFGNPGEGEVILALEVSPEPKVLWQSLQSIRIDRATDDLEQKLSQVTPQVETPGAIGGGIVAPGFAPQIAIAPGFPMPGMMGGQLGAQVPVQLKKGDKQAKSLKELKGVITAQMLTEVQPVLVADKLKAGETAKCKEGGYIKIVEVKSEDEQTTIRLELQQPPMDKIVPAQPNGGQIINGGGVAPLPVPIRAPRRGVRIQPAPAGPAPAAPPPAGFAAPPQAAPPPPPAQVQVAPARIQVIGGGATVIVGGAGLGGNGGTGLTMQDDKGNALPMQVTQIQTRFEQQGGGAFVQTMIYTMVSRHEKDKGKPTKVAFLGRRHATVEIPFALKDVPLP
jgi:hypothetical protein